MKNLIRSLIAFVLVVGTTTDGMAQLFRSATSGNWNAIGTWQQSTDGGTSWVPAAATPTNASDAITIRATHTVTVTSTVNLDDVTIEAGGTVTTTTGSTVWTIANGTFGVKIFGTFNANAGGGSFGCCGTVSVENGGVVNMNSGGAFFGPTTVQSGGTVIGNTSINLGSGTIVNHGTWTMTGSNAITLSGGGSLVNNGTMVWRGGTLSGTLTNNGTLTWSGGTITSSPLGVINNGATATLVCNGTTAQNGSINNQGTFTWSAGTFLSFTAIGTFLNAPSAIFNMAGNAGFNTFYQAVTNQGTINFSVAGSMQANPGTSLNNSGVINVNSGTLIWSHATSNNGSLNIANGATLEISQSTTINGPVSNAGTLMGSISSFTGTTFTNNGNVTLTSLPFSGTAAQTLDGTGSITNLTLNNANGLTLGGSQTVTGTLTLTNGHITLGNNDLVLSNTALAALVGGNATNHIVTNGNGSFRRNLPVSGANYPFPIGTGASYLPVTLSNTSGPQERFGARVQNNVHSDYSTPGTPAGTLVQNEQVERTWTITEQTDGGNQATVQLQWNATDEGAGFGRANSALHSYNGTDWVALPLGAAGGSNPYTRSSTSIALFREFTVADGESTLPFVCNNGLTPGSACNDNDACTINDVVTAGCECAGTFQDADGDGTCDVNDGCPNDPNKIVAGICGCGVSDVDSDNDGTLDCNDDCPLDPNKTEFGDCGCGVSDTDTDNDGTADCNDGCPGDPLKTASGSCGCGTPDVDLNNDGVCDGGACTAYIAPALGGVGEPAISITPACPPSNLAFVSISICSDASGLYRLYDEDTELVVDFGTMNGCGAIGNGCPGGGANCLWESWELPAGSYSLRLYQDLSSEPLLACAAIPFSVPGSGECCDLGPVGTACDADPGPGELPGTVNSACACIPNCTETVTLELRTDALSSQASWQILDQNTDMVLCQFTIPIDGITSPITENCCLPEGCYRLRVLDSGGDGFVSGGINGGYQLRESGANGRRIIDNLGNFDGGGLSAIATTYDNGAFCLPIGDDKLIWSSCDKLDWIANKFIVAAANPAVSAQFGITNASSGYEFWFFDPNGSYSFRRFRSHATSDGTGSGATRACHFKVNGWVNSVANPHIPANVLLNVRVRGRVAGNNLPFGPACLFKLDPALAACPRVKLQDDPANTSDYSCGVTRNFGGPSNVNNRIHANPPQPVPVVASNMVRYQFRFRIAGEGICIVRPPQTSARMVLNWTSGTPLECGKTYEVDVRVSLDGGATWCFGPAMADQASNCAFTDDWGNVCNVTINPCALPSGSGTSMVVEEIGHLTLYPNPNHGDQLFVSLAGLESGVRTVNLDLFDLTGKRLTIKTMVVNEGSVNTHLDLSHAGGELADGIYLLHITAGDKTYTERLVIQR